MLCSLHYQLVCCAALATLSVSVLCCAVLCSLHYQLVLWWEMGHVTMECTCACCYGYGTKQCSLYSIPPCACLFVCVCVCACVCSRLEGQLQKWTNALKGWQSRWLSVDQQQGVLHYYTVRVLTTDIEHPYMVYSTCSVCLSQSEDRKKFPPRGSLHLWGAVIAPSDEDSQTFSVNGANGEVRVHSVSHIIQLVLAYPCMYIV